MAEAAPFQLIPCDGGLDLITAPQAVQAGRLIDCLNYEVAYTRGYRRMDGYEPFDGGLSPTVLSTSAWQVGTAVNGGNYVFLFNVGATNVEVLLTLPNGVILPVIIIKSNNSYDVGSNTTFLSLYFVVSSNQQLLIPGLGCSLQAQTLTGIPLSSPSVPIMLTTLPINTTTSGLLTDYQNFYTATISQVQQVPGQGNVNGLFWLKDNLYATRDYLAIPFFNGTVQPQQGDQIYIGAGIGMATWSANVAKVTVTSGSWSGISAGNAAGVIMVYNQFGTLTGSTINNNTQSLSSVLTASTASATSTAAGLYLASGGRGGTLQTQSWQWCDLGWYINYTGTITQQIDMNLSLSSFAQILQGATTGSTQSATAWKTGTAGNANGWQVSGGTWPTVVTTVGDTQYAYHYFYDGATSTPVSGTFTLTNFGFTSVDIPPNSIVTGIEIQFSTGAIFNTGATARSLDQNFTLLGVAYGQQPNLASAVPYTALFSAINVNTAQYASFTFNTIDTGPPVGSSPYSQSLLGYNQIRIQDILSTNFGIAYSAKLQGTQTAQAIQLGIDRVRMRITFQPQTNLVYFWNSNGTVTPTAVIAQVVKKYNSNGGVATSATVQGTLYLQFIQSNGTVGGPPSRPIGAGEQIRSYPTVAQAPDGGAADGSALLSTTTSSAGMNCMDWSLLLNGQAQPDGTLTQASKYQSVTKNFYASTGTEAIYGVSGGGPAFYYDGVKTDASGNAVVGNFCRILTGLPGQFETPRSICAHQGHVVLGYGSGIFQWGNQTNVLSFNPTEYDQSAASEQVGEVITGVGSVNGSALIIGGRNQVFMLQGQISASASLVLSTLSSNSGVIEYTLQPLLMQCFADFRGITSLQTTDEYGDFSVEHLSYQVSPFLIPRVQLSTVYEVQTQGVSNSCLIRNKNQYRLFFNDGYVLTATLVSTQEQPQFTIQRYFASDGATAQAWGNVQAFTSTLGRDRIFATDRLSTGYVYELDRGRSFMGAAITGYATLVPETAQAPYNQKLYQGVNVYGQATDFATFQMSRTPDYVTAFQATGGNVNIQTFGAGSVAPTGLLKPTVTLGQSGLQLEGTAINIRFDSSSAIQNPHTIQAIAYTVEPMATENQ
jgi:hypothetical protein